LPLRSGLLLMATFISIALLMFIVAIPIGQCRSKTTEFLTLVHCVSRSLDGGEGLFEFVSWLTGESAEL